MNYEEINGYTKNMYKVSSVLTGYKYYKHLLLEKCFGMYTYKGLPESLPPEQIETRLIMQGWCSVFNHNTEGLVTSYGGISGVDKYYLPTDFVYAQPVLGSGNLKIHKDCVILWNSQIDQYERNGLWQLILRYARMLADFDSSISIMTVNNRATKMNVVDTDQVGKTVDEAMRKMELGERYTINQKSILDLYKTIDWNEQKDGKIAELLTAKEEILSSFLSEIGVKTSSDKKEREITDEIYADDQLLTVNVDDMLVWRKKGIDEINKLFGTKISVERNSAYEIKEREV